MGVAPDDGEAGEAQVLACLETVGETDDYRSQVQALRTIEELAAEPENQLAHERFIGKQADGVSLVTFVGSNSPPPIKCWCYLLRRARWGAPIQHT